MRRTVFFALLPLFAFISACTVQKEPSPKIITTPSIRPSSLPTTSILDRDDTLSEPETIEYQVEQRLTIANKGPGKPDKHNIWIALITDVALYQEVVTTSVSPSDYRIITDEYQNEYAEFDLSEIHPGMEISIQIQYGVKINRLAYDLGKCEGELPTEFVQPELHIESNNIQIIELANQLSGSEQNPCQKIRSFYDYIGNTLVYSYNGANWGAQAALGEMGADCTEFASLMIALSRAAGIPARYLEGLLYFPQDADPLARTEHAWLEVYLPGVGWVPMDPTLGRSSIYRDSYFAKIPPDHIILTRGRNPSTLRGSSYWTHLYWPGDSTTIQVKDAGWTVRPIEP